MSEVDQNDWLDDELAFDASSAMPQSLNGYKSPVLRKMVKQRLTLVFLAEHVPVFRAGEQASERLEEGKGLSAKLREELRRAVLDGERAKEALVSAAIPLVRLLANKEFERRGGIQGKVRSTGDELFQEGIIGLLSGLRNYDPAGQQVSPTNYLSSWITVSMRRGTDSAEHDFTLGYGVSERFRRIHAIRTRLSAELGRPPTDEEIIAAWTDITYLPGRMMGRVAQADQIAKNVVTHKQLAEERLYASRMGVKSMPIAEDGSTHLFDSATPLETDHAATAEEAYGDSDAKRFLAELLERTLGLLQVAPPQRHVIALRFGLDGYDEHPVAGIMAATNTSRAKVNKILEVFAKEMSRKNGAFHKLCATVEPEDLASCGLGWVTKSLGEYTYAQISPPVELSVPLDPADSRPPPPPVRPNERPGQVRAQFQCPIHKTGFVGAYRDRGEVPKTRACPRCDTPSPVIRVLIT